MPAYFDTGFSVRQPMWHGEGLVLDDYPVDWNDARNKAGLLWEPESRETYQRLVIAADAVRDGDVVFPTVADRDSVVRGIEQVEVLRPLPDHKLIVRNDNENVLGVVGSGFEIVSHTAMGEILETILDSNGGHVKFETAGSCKGGAQVWALVYLDEPYKVPGDNSQTIPFMALLNNHDGSGACKLVRTQVRVVCWNTYNAAWMEGERSGMQFTFRHTAKVHERIEEAKAALAGLRNEAAEWTEMATELFGIAITDKTFAKYLNAFIPEPPGDITSETVKRNIDTARNVFRSLYMDSTTTEAHRGTALGLVDASVEYLDHVRGFRNQDTYMGRTLLRPEPMKAKAVTLVRQIAGASK